MKHSWSEQLFFRINRMVGRRPFLDAAMTFCAHYLLYFLGVGAFVWAAADASFMDPSRFERYLKLLITAGAFGFVTSWTIGFLFPHERPYKEHRGVRHLITPLGTWKSFPSDHTIAGFTIAFITTLVGAPLWMCIGIFLGAALVSMGRVYVGVHYPRDIVGGIMVALLFSFSSFWLLDVVMEPWVEGIQALFPEQYYE